MLETQALLSSGSVAGGQLIADSLEKRLADDYVMQKSCFYRRSARIITRGDSADVLFACTTGVNYETIRNVLVGTALRKWRIL
jgi:hypothetical protein